MIWFYSINGTISEAVDQSIIEEMIFQGQLGGPDYVWREGWQEWRALKEADDFSHALARKSVPKPPPLPNSLGSKYASSEGFRAGEEKEWEIAPGVKMTFCWCPPGEFLMGPSLFEEEYGDWEEEEQVQVRVVLTKGFWMGKTQVTQLEWATIMGKNPSFYKGANLPVENIRWTDAEEFLEKLNALLGNPDGGKMVLPTEAQWEYAARAGQWTIYAGSDQIDEVAWYDKNSGIRTHPVGTKKPNAWGLHDMSGNVPEWCQDWYCDKLSGGTDPSGPSSGTERVIRGGLCDGDACYCRISFRSGEAPASPSNYDIGFRVARSSLSSIQPSEQKKEGERSPLNASNGQSNSRIRFIFPPVS